MLVGVVLAGGQSLRMGTDKALLRLNGQTQLQRCQELLTGVGCDHILISRNQNDSNQNNLNQKKYLKDEHLDIGPLAGIHRAIKTEPNAKGYLVVPVDMPYLREDVLKKLLNQTESTYYTDAILPCYIANQDQLLSIIEGLIARQHLSIRGLLSQLSAHAITADNPQWLINTNTPAQWQKISQEVSNGS